MVYRRRYGVRRRFRRKFRKYGKSKRYSRKGKVSISRLPRSVVPEVKKFSLHMSDQKLETTNTAVLYNSQFTDIDLGDDFNERTGSKVFIKYLMFNIGIVPSSAASFNTWRIAIFEDNEPGINNYATALTWTDIYLDTSNTYTNLFATRNPIFVPRLKCRKNIIGSSGPSVIHALSLSGGTGTSSNSSGIPKNYQFKIPVNKTITFGANNEIKAGVKFWIVAWGNQDDTLAPQLHMTCRTYYTDA